MHSRSDPALHYGLPLKTRPLTEAQAAEAIYKVSNQNGRGRRFKRKRAVPFLSMRSCQ